MDLIWALLLLVLLVSCWMTTLLGLPGNWMMVVASGLYVVAIGPDARFGFGWTVVIVLALLAVIGEAIELAASALGVSRLGGSRRSAILSLVGSLAGGVAGLFVGLPIPVVGPLVGTVLLAAVGALIGAMLGETWKGRDFDTSWKIGKAALVARLLATVAKVMIGSVILVTVAASMLLA
ncbi:MAG: DUF456 domain-containing protein [Pirellulales bacterium]